MGRRGQDKAKLDRECQKNLPELKSARDLEYGFKIRCARAAVSGLAWWRTGRLLAFARLHGVACHGDTLSTCCRDKENPKTWYVAKGITIIPPQKLIKGSPFESAKDFFSTAFAGN